MIKIRNLTVKNFMSVGNATQAINFDRDDLTLVLGENLDLGSNGARNGTGKTTLINALSYALYGQALTNIKRNNLINKTNSKNMLVSIEFDIDNESYRIERGRSPNVLKFFKNDEEQHDDEARGEMRDTQKEIESTLNISHDMFKHILALNTYTPPFLSLRAHEQKNIIEQLLGITLLTEKAEKLKEIHRNMKTAITEEEYRIKAVIDANKHIEDQISSLERRQKMWQKKKDETVSELANAVEALMDIDVELEIQHHNDNAEAKIFYDKTVSEYEHNRAIVNQKISEHNAKVAECNRWIKAIEREQKTNERRQQALEKDIQLLANHKCHACGNDLHDETQEKNKAAKEEELKELGLQYLANESQEFEHKQTLSELGAAPEFIEVHIDKPEFKETFYDSVEEAHGHKSKLETITVQLETAVAEVDPYDEQINDMKESAIQEVSYDELNRLTEMLEHQAFLLKLLTSKDSFIRRKIIESNLSYLNNRLTHYLDEIKLPHQIKFLSDLSVEITELGRDLDFDNLSRGERTRLILSLSWAFRDVWESLYSHINLMFIDELIDNGLDTDGVESAVRIMKGLARERNKSVWLVSHREELLSRVNNTLTVRKEGGFTSYNEDM